MTSPFSADFCTVCKSGLAWLVCLLFCMAIFLAPALWNGFALVFHDTGGYVGRVMEMTLLPGRSFFYGLFLWAASFGWWSFWGPVLVQSLFTLWLIHLMLRCHELPAGPIATTVFCGGLGVSTGVSWYTSQLMPDALVPLVVLAFWLLGFRWERLGRGERAGLAAVALLGLLSHMSCMALAVGLAMIIFAARCAARRWSGALSVNSMPPVGVVVAGLIFMPTVHLALMGQATYTPGGPAYIFGRLVQEGIAQRWLAEHCPVSGVKLCTLQNRIPDNGNMFLWAQNSPFQDIGGWSGKGDPEMSYLAQQCFKAYPGLIFRATLRATAKQMAMVATGEGLAEFHGAVREVFSRLLPRTAESFNAAYQQQGRITRSLFKTLNQIHVPAIRLSMVGLLMVIGWGWHIRRPDLSGVAFFTLTALLGNAFICGALSNPFDRYQSRLVWLATLVVGMTVASWWQFQAGRAAEREKE